MKPIVKARLKLWLGIAASAVGVGTAVAAVAGAHADIVHRLDALEEGRREDRELRADIADIKAELRLVRRFFRIPDESAPPVRAEAP